MAWALCVPCAWTWVTNSCWGSPAGCVHWHGGHTPNLVVTDHSGHSIWYNKNVHCKIEKVSKGKESASLRTMMIMVKDGPPFSCVGIVVMKVSYCLHFSGAVCSLACSKYPSPPPFSCRWQVNYNLCELGPDLIWPIKLFILQVVMGPKSNPAFILHFYSLHRCGVVSLSSPKKELVGKGRVCWPIDPWFSKSK
jgi:hypothetical protein